MPSVWIETRSTPKGPRFRVVWREVAFDSQGNAIKGARKKSPQVSDETRADKIKLAKISELEDLEAGLKPKTIPRSWKAVADLYLEHSKNHKSIKTYKHFDKPAIDAFSTWLGDRVDSPVQGIGAEDIQSFEAHLLAKQKPAGASARLRCIRAALHHARKAGWIDRVPAFHLPRVEDDIGRALSGEEIGTLFQALKGEARRGATILLYTGMRLGELFELMWENCSNGEARIKTLKRAQGARQRFRIVPLHPEVLAALGPSGSGVVMRCTRNAFESSWAKTVRRLEWPRTRIHDLRHTWATRFMEKTGDLYALMRLGGWSDLQSVERYQHLTKGRSTAILLLDFGIKTPQSHPEEKALTEDALLRS